MYKALDKVDFGKTTMNKSGFYQTGTVRIGTQGTDKNGFKTGSMVLEKE
jgi:hypothetical protein